MRFSPDFIDKVREASNIVDVIAPYTQLHPSGSNLMGRCPFPDHNDKTASFSISEDKQLYNCFGCKKSGNVFSFLKDFNGYSFPEAVEFLAHRAHIPLPERDEDPKAKRQREEREAVLTVNRLAASYFYESLKKLPSDHSAKVYVEKRGLTPEVIEAFKIGFSPDDWQGFVRVLRTRNLRLETAEKAGLVRKSNRTGGDSHYDLFRGRLMFPIFSTSGDALGFGGRVLVNEEPKYLNSPETPVFHKGRVLYGLDVTARYIRAQDEAIIVEGYMDALALYRAGIQNVAAILGTAFTSDHGKLLSRMTSNVLMLLDGDRAGIQGAERSLAALLKSGIRPRGLILPEGMDPDDFLRKNSVDVFKSEVASAGDLFTLLLTKHWMRDYRATASDRLAVVERVAQALAPAGLEIINTPMAELFIAETARYLDVESTWVRKTLTGSIAKVSAVQYRNQETNSTLAPQASVQVAVAQLAARSVAPATIEPQSDSQPDLRPDLSGVSREETVALGLLLQSRFLMADLNEASKDWLASGAGKEDHPIAQLFDHEGARRIIGKALRKYGQEPSAFDTVAASLLMEIIRPDILQRGISEASLLLELEELSLDSSGNSVRNKAVARGTDGRDDGGETAELHRRQMAKILNAVMRRRKQLEIGRLGRELSRRTSGDSADDAMERYVSLQRELRELEAERLKMNG